MKNLIANHQDDIEETTEENKTKKKVSSDVPQTVLEKLARSSGFDIGMLIQMKDGNRKAYDKFYAEKGIHQEIAKGIIGLSSNNDSLLKDSILQICKELKIAPQLSFLISQMIFNSLTINEKKSAQILSTRFMQ
jgi:hypothetical protein